MLPLIAIDEVSRAPPLSPAGGRRSARPASLHQSYSLTVVWTPRRMLPLTEVLRLYLARDAAAAPCPHRRRLAQGQRAREA